MLCNTERNSRTRQSDCDRRKKSGIIQTWSKDISKRIIINNDNDEKRKIVEHCQLQGKTVFNVICDWLNDDVKDYIKEEHINLNPLYKCGFHRVGCVGCPMAGKGRYKEFALYPKYRNLYIRAFDRMLEVRKQAGLTTNTWQSGIDVFHWWMEDNVLPGQLTIDGENDW